MHALASAYEDGARAAGRDVTMVRIAALGVLLLGTDAEFYGGVTPREIPNAKHTLIRCDHIVIVYPLWLGYMPVFVLKGFLEQLFRRAVA